MERVLFEMKLHLRCDVLLVLITTCSGFYCHRSRFQAILMLEDKLTRNL
ncbi:unnamed protein product [Phytomonas sp. EM1]|nr:unnamed protein product [Phytomonas sp. EM1]|eukprot:CCW61192.1 unnamed protein product [Phytomonas sp. isolate EM1]